MTEHDTKAALTLEDVFRYLLKVGYSYGFKGGCDDRSRYDDDFGKNFDLSSLRKPEAGFITRALGSAAQEAELVEALEDAIIEIENELQNLGGDHDKGSLEVFKNILVRLRAANAEKLVKPQQGGE